MKTTFTAEPLTQQEQSTYNALYDSYSNGGPVFNTDDYRAFRETLENSDPRLTTNYIRESIGFRNGMDPAVSQSKNYLTNGKLGANPASSSSSSKSPAEAKYITAKDALDAAKQNLNYATDPMQESQMRKELQMAQLAYDAAKEEFAKSKLQEANLITEDQAAGREPITPRNGRKYEGVGKKAQNPERAAERESEITQARNALETAKTNMAYVTDEASEAEARKALNQAQANYDKAMGKHVISDEERVGLVGKGAAKGWGTDMLNAGATTAAGLNQLGQKLGGDTGEYAGWATDEVSRAAIPKQNDQKYWDQQRKEVEDIQGVSDRLAASSQADIDKAKEGTRGITKLAVDVGSNAIQMGMDGLAAVLTGGSSLAAMGARSMGGAAREARNDGASIAQQIAYGVVRGGIELATEKMFDGLAGIYGKGAADDIVESVIGKMAKSDLGRTALRGLFSGVGEALEEGVSGVTEPLTQAIYKGIASIPKGYNKEQAAEVLYSMLVGFAMGGAGTAVNVISGGNAQANAKLRVAENESKQTAPAVEQNATPAVEAAPTNPTNPIVPQKARNYEGTGNKAQNPEKVAAKAAAAPAPAVQPAAQPAAPVNPVAANPEQAGPTTATNGALNNGRTSFGSRGVAYTDNNTPVNFTYAVVSLSDLTTSHDAYGNENTAYPKEMQPRDRSRVESQRQVSNIGKSLNPARVGASAEVSTGAPVVRNDGVVVAGNGRVSGITLAYENGRAGDYENYIREHAAEFGIDPNSIPENPVLVRISDDVDNWAQLARESNESSVSTYSATEQGMTDAAKLKDNLDILDLLADTETGDINTNENLPFIQAFVNRIVPATERAGMLTADGKLSQAGLERMQNAIFAAAYGDTSLLQNLSESLDADSKNVLNALLRTASNALATKNAVDAGNMHNVKANEVVLAAVDLYNQSRAAGIPVEELASKGSMFGEYSAEEVSIAQGIEALKRAPNQLTSFLNKIYNKVADLGNPNQVSLFGDEDVSLRGVVENAESDFEQSDANKSEKSIPRPDYDRYRSYGDISEHVSTKGEGQSQPTNADNSTSSGRDITGSPDEEGTAESPVTPSEEPLRSEGEKTQEESQESSEAPSGELNSQPQTPQASPQGSPTNNGSNAQGNQQNNQSNQSNQNNQNQNNNGNPTPPPSGNNGQNWTGPDVPTQSTFHDQLTDQEKTRDELNPDNDTHVQHHDTEVDAFAQDRITNQGYDGARTDLMSRDPADWDDVDVRTAQMLLTKELENARQLTGQAQDDAYKRIAELKNAYNKQGTEQGRALRQRQRFGGSKTEIVSESANILYGEENQGKTRKLSPDQKSAIMQQVDEFSTQLEEIKESLGIGAESANENATNANAENTSTEADIHVETPDEVPDNTQSNAPSGSPTTTPANPNGTPPTNNHANTPVNNPSNNPTNNPQNNPNSNPTNNPTNNPANNPSGNPNAPTNKPAKNPMSLKDLIMLVARVRKTNAFLDVGQAKLGKVIDSVAKMDGGTDFLVQLATTQIRSIASDQIKASFWDKAKALRYMNMLSNPATASRNVGANTVFGNFIDAVSSNLSSPIDALMSLATGKRTVRTERLSKAGLKGSVEAGLKSWLEVSLDAEAEQSTYAYNEIKGRTFKASGNFIEHILSVLERNQGYQLKTTDQIAKGGIEGETKRNLMKGGMDAATAEQLAKEEAEYRTLQNDSGMSRAAQGLRNALNNVLSIKGKDGKVRYGLGEDVLPFAQVPANVVQTELDLNPLSIIPAIGKVFSVMADGKNATASQQRAAAKAVGKALNGTAMVAAAALMSAKGVLRYTNDDDKDQKQLHKAEGKSGLQINFSAAARLFTGGDPAEQEGDKWGNIGWIPQLNSLLIIGNMVYDDYKDMPEHKDLADWAKFSGKVGLDSLKGMYESVLEFPAVSTITSMINAAKYANVPDDATDAERLGIQAGAVLTDKAANTLTGFTIPNVLRATAAGLDDTERNLYGADTRLGQAVDAIKAGIPDNPLIPKEYTRGSLPAQTDNFGNPIKNEGGTQQFLNKVILPGAITTDQRNALLDEIDRVAMSSGNADAIPDKNGAYSVTYNGEKINLSAEEREEYHRYAGQKSEDYIKSFVGSSIYQDMTDDQRAETMAKLNQQAKSEANKHYLETHKKEAVDKLTDGKDAPGTSNDYTPLNKSNIANYYAYETMMKDAVENGDYKTIDSLTRKYNSLNTNIQTVLSERDDSLRQVLKWSNAGIGSETYYKFKDATIASQKKLDKSSRTGSVVELDALASMDIPESEKRKIINSVADVGSKTVTGVYNILSDYGFNSKQINDFWNMSQDWKYKDGGTQSAQKAGTLQPLEAYYAISMLPGLSNAQRNDIYNQMKEVANVPYAINDWGNYTYTSEDQYYKSGRSKQEFGTSNVNQLFTPRQTSGQQSSNYNALLKSLGIAG